MYNESMADVEFNEEYLPTPVPLAATQSGSDMERKLVRMGWAKDVTQSREILWIVVIIAIFTMGIVIFFGFRESGSTPLGPREQTVIPGPGGARTSNLHDTR